MCKREKSRPHRKIAFSSEKKWGQPRHCLFKSPIYSAQLSAQGVSFQLGDPFPGVRISRHGATAGQQWGLSKRAEDFATPSAALLSCPGHRAPIAKSSALKTRSQGRNQHGGTDGLPEHFGLSTRRCRVTSQVFSPESAFFEWDGWAPVCTYTIYRRHGTGMAPRRGPSRPSRNVKGGGDSQKG